MHHIFYAFIDGRMVGYLPEIIRVLPVNMHLSGRITETMDLILILPGTGQFLWRLIAYDNFRLLPSALNRYHLTVRY